MLLASSVTGVFRSIISSFMLLIIVGFYLLLSYAAAQPRPLVTGQDTATNRRCSSSYI